VETVAAIAGGAVLAAMVYILHGYFVPGSSLFGKVHARGHTSEKVVALTFDDGPDPSYTQRIMDVLGEHGVRATFFVRGTAAGRHTARRSAQAPRRQERGNQT
jgi:peptidoglycan-N-acetylglucosamine deacetylase